MLREIWILMLVVSLACFVSGVVLIFGWKIPTLVDELSGRKAKRQIKMLHNINTSTSTFDKLSTTEIYSGMSSGSVLVEELNSIDEQNIKKEVSSIKESVSGDLSKPLVVTDDERPTSYIDESEEATSFIVNEETGYINLEEIATLRIEILEEQTSL